MLIPLALGMPRHTFSAMFGAVIARGEDYRQVFQYFRPDLDPVRVGVSLAAHWWLPD
ncbi:MAG: hypothetical protein WCF33_20830 [Pseudonocardiaceae bacterium]